MITYEIRYIAHDILAQRPYDTFTVYHYTDIHWAVQTILSCNFVEKIVGIYKIEDGVEEEISE